MALDDTENPDIAEDGGNGDEQSNRTFRILALALGGIGVLGLILIGATLLTQNSARLPVQATNQAIYATNTAVAAMALITPSPVPTDTPMPTDTLAPTATSRPTTAPTRVPPTAAPTQAAAAVGTEAAQTPAAASGTTTAGGTSSATGTPATQSPAGGSSNAAGTPGTSATASAGATSSQAPTATPTANGAQLAPTGAGDSLGLLALAGGLVAVLVVARRLRMSQA